MKNFPDDSQFQICCKFEANILSTGPVTFSRLQSHIFQIIKCKMEKIFVAECDISIYYVWQIFFNTFYNCHVFRSHHQCVRKISVTSNTVKSMLVAIIPKASYGIARKFPKQFSFISCKICGRKHKFRENI